MAKKTTKKTIEKGICLVFDSPGQKLLTVTLKRGLKALDTVDFSFDKNLDTLLIGYVDKLLKRNKISITRIDKVKFGTGLDKNSSLYRIVKTWQIAFEMYKKYSK